MSKDHLTAARVLRSIQALRVTFTHKRLVRLAVQSKVFTDAVRKDVRRLVRAVRRDLRQLEASLETDVLTSDESSDENEDGEEEDYDSDEDLGVTDAIRARTPTPTPA